MEVELVEVLVGVCGGCTGENGEWYTPAVKGLDSFTGQIVHSIQYKSGNSGMSFLYKKIWHILTEFSRK